MDYTTSGISDEQELNNTEDTAGKTEKKRRPAPRKRGRRRADPGRFMIARLLVIVTLVLVVFEGNIIFRLFTHRVGSSNISVVGSSLEGQTEGLIENQADDSGDISVSGDNSESPAASGTGEVLSLAGGISDDAGAGSGQADDTGSSSSFVQNSEAIDSPKVVPERSEAVDDSFFSNAVFIGDSRMEGFRNSSGITQGTFLTGVGLAVNDMGKQIITTADGTISVYQGLSGHQYDRIYLMLGANDLGYYPWEDFLPTFESVLKQFHELQPGAIIYVCSVIYVDETKIQAGFEYDNNDNVRTINGYIIQACEDLWYSYYLNLNEIFSDGNGELIQDASPDGIHLYAEYLEMMLNYLKTHYITDEEFAAEKANHPDDIANAASADGGAEDETEDASGGSGGDSSDVSVN